MFFQQASYLDQNLYCVGYPGHEKNPALGQEVHDYTDPASNLTSWECWALALSPGGAGGVLGRGCIGSGVGCLCRSAGSALGPLRLQHICGFSAVTFWQERYQSRRFWWSIAGCVSITAFTFQCSGYSTRRFFTSRTSVQGYMIRYFGCSLAVHDNPPLAILALFKARPTSDCCSCTRPPCLAIVADMLKTYKKLVAASNNEIQQVP